MTTATITALAGLLDVIIKIGAFKVGSALLLIAFLPDLIFILIVLLILNKYDKVVGRYDRALTELQKQHDDFRLKYDNNIELVKQVTKIAESLQEVVVYNTQVMQSVHDTVTNNLFCPMVRKDPKVEVRP